MNEMQMKDVEFIVESYDFDKQLEQAIEEASEFILAAQKFKRFPQEATRKTDLIEETGDLLICAEQMRLYLGSQAVDDSVDYKLRREKERIWQKWRYEQ